MWGSKIELQDWVLNSTVGMSQGCSALSGERLVVALEGGLNFTLTGLSAARLLFMGPPLPQDGTVTTTVAAHLDDLDQFGVEIASGMLILSFAFFSSVQEGQENPGPAVIQYVTFLCKKATQGNVRLPHLVPLAAQSFPNSSLVWSLLAKVTAFYYGSMAPNDPIRQAALQSMQSHLEYLMMELHTLGQFRKFLTGNDFSQMMNSAFKGMRRIAIYHTRHPISGTIIGAAPTILLQANVDCTCTLLLAFPQGRRLLFNLIYGIEQEFAEQDMIQETDFKRWLDLVACAILYVGEQLSPAEQKHMKDFHYLSRYMPLFDRIVSSGPGEFSDQTIESAMQAMVEMAQLSPAEDRASTFAFMREHRPIMASVLLAQVVQEE